jgi:hypothetical protein
MSDFVPLDENAAPNVAKKAPKKGKTIEETYTKKTQLEHILLRPDTYGTFKNAYITNNFCKIFNLFLSNQCSHFSSMML